MMDIEYLHLCKTLAEQGDKKAMLALAEEYQSKSCKDLLEGEYETTLAYLFDLATKETPASISTRAMLLLGVIHYTGWFKIEQNYTQARIWYEKAAALEFEITNQDSEAFETIHWALTNLGYCYYYGRDIKIDYEKAFHYFAKAAFYNNHNAMYKLGDMYYYGLFVKQNYETAFYWYKKAEGICEDCFMEYPNISYRIGVCNLYAKGTPKDLLIALSYLQSAELNFYRLIELGDSFARLTLSKVQKEIDVVRQQLNQSFENINQT